MDATDRQKWLICQDRFCTIPYRKSSKRQKNEWSTVPGKEKPPFFFFENKKNGGAPQKAILPPKTLTAIQLRSPECLSH